MSPWHSAGMKKRRATFEACGETQKHKWDVTQGRSKWSGRKEEKREDTKTHATMGSQAQKKGGFIKKLVCGDLSASAIRGTLGRDEEKPSRITCM